MKNYFKKFIKDFQFNNGEWFTGSWESVIIFSHIISNVNFVETYMFHEFQKHQAWNMLQQYLHMSAVYLGTIKHLVKIIYIIILLNSDTNVYVITT